MFNNKYKIALSERRTMGTCTDYQRKLIKTPGVVAGVVQCSKFTFFLFPKIKQQLLPLFGGDAERRKKSNSNVYCLPSRWGLDKLEGMQGAAVKYTTSAQIFIIRNETLKG